MQKLVIYLMAALFMLPPAAMVSSPAQAQVTIRPAHPGYYPPPSRRHYARPYDRRYYGGYDRRYYRDDRRYYRHYNRRRHNDAIAAGVAGLAVGAIVGGALSNQNRRSYSNDRHAYCYSRYRSYDARTGTYLGYDGRRHYCR